MTPWLDPLIAALDAEFGPKPRVASFASVDEEGRPRVRSVVCRQIGEDGALFFASDSRSRKNAHIRRHPEVEICFWLPGLRQQFRLAGVASIVPAEDDRRVALWLALSDRARALFEWPAPGRPRVAGQDAFPKEIGEDTPVPENFEVIEVRPDRVDHLDLTDHPHRRLRFRAAEGWAEEVINP